MAESFIEQHPAILVAGAIGAGYFVYVTVQKRNAAQAIAEDPNVPSNSIDTARSQGPYSVWGQQPGTTYVSEEQLNEAMKTLRDEWRAGMGNTGGIDGAGID